jgi:putative acetyltransferase
VPVIRPEAPGDYAAIRRLNELAFAGPAEGELIDLLRASGDVLVSLVAVEEESVVGHILFSRLLIATDQGTVNAAALAPMGVLPEFQNRGIGSALVRAGLSACRDAGETIVVVVGHRDFYPRFGFSARLASQLTSPYSGDSCMALELQPGAMSNLRGTVRYAAPFSKL